MVVHRINLKLPFVNRQLHADGQIVLALIFLNNAVRSVLVFAHQHKVLPVRPDLLSVMHPLACRKACHGYAFAAFKLFFQQLSAQQLRNGFCILAVKLNIAVMLKAHQHRHLILFTDALVAGFARGIQYRRLFFRLRSTGIEESGRLRLLCRL